MDHDQEVSERVIGCAIEVHRVLGPGLLESVYEEALCLELASAGIPFKRQLIVPVFYKGQPVGEYRLDLLVADTVVVEIKSVERRVGLVINFNSRLLRDGIKRVVR